MRIRCRYCGNKAHIARVEEESLRYTKLYCVCLEPYCAHSFVSEIGFSHTLTPSKIKPADIPILDRIRQLTDEQQKQLLGHLDM